MKSEFTIKLLGRELTIRSDSDAAHVQAVEALAKEHLDQIPQGLPVQHALMLATLSLADALLRERQQHLSLKEKIRARSAELLTRLNVRRVA